jgi:3-oxoacyl-(acyl-carrier-protein) synthase/acyl carrier protein
LEKHIAVIGISGIFPDAKNVYELYHNLANGLDSVRDISDERLAETMLPGDLKYIKAGFLQDIASFDHKHFRISKGEAIAMDPHQRLLLQCVHHLFESAGYRPADFDGSDTAVFAADTALDYYKQAPRYEPTLSTGNTNAFTAARISRHFGLHGTSMMIDTTCSSSLQAIHLACNELILGDAQTALACAAHLHLYPLKSDFGLGLESPDGKSKAFSSRADGMSVGESVASVLLKPLKQAIKDGDNILAVITGSASNSNANLSGSLTAPDSIAQSKVILRAWEKAGIHPLDIGFIETHGSGTQLGDSVEIGGLNTAFQPYGSKVKFCPISTIKSNIGHTRTAAGIVSFIKTVLSINKAVIFPTIHFDNPNPIIDFERSPVYVNTTFRKWGDQHPKRIGGVSSIGLSGTNVHIVLEDAEQYCNPKTGSTGPYLFLFSSNTKEGLLKQMRSFRKYLEIFPTTDLEDASFTLANGRQHYPIRCAIKAFNYDDLISQLADPAIDAPAETLIGYVLVLEDVDYSLTSNHSNFLNLPFKEYFNSIYPHGTDTPLSASFSVLYTMYKVLVDGNVTFRDVLSWGVGKIAARAAADEITREEAIHALGAYLPKDTGALDKNLDAFIDNQLKRFGAFGVVAVGKGIISNKLRQKQSTEQRCRVFELNLENVSESLLDLHQWLYHHGIDCTKETFKFLPGKRIDLPGYEFQPTYCWIRDTPQRAETLKQLFNQWVERNETSAIATGNLIETQVAECWRRILGAKTFTKDQSFFDLGGDSLKATRVTNELNVLFCASLDFEDIFDFQSVATLSSYINESLTTEDKLSLYWKKVLRVRKVSLTDNFFDLGGHSLLANQVINLIFAELKFQVDFDTFFKYPTIKAMAEYLKSLDENSGSEGERLITPVPSAAHYPLSIIQKSLWLACQRKEGLVAYNQPNAYLVDGYIDFDIVQNVFQEIVSRHEILRTTFITVGKEPRQVVHTSEEFNFNVSFLKLPSDKVDEYLISQSQQPFDLSKGPLLFLSLIELTSSTFILYINIHHLISDGWSMRILTNEFLRIYKARASNRNAVLPQLPIQYKDYAAWSHSIIETSDFKELKFRLMRQFESEVPHFNLSNNRAVSQTSSYEGGRATIIIQPQLLDKLNTFRSRYSFTLFSSLVTFIEVLLYENFQINDMVVGIPFAARTDMQLENLVGYFANVVPVRLSIQPQQSMVEVNKIVQQRLLNSSDCQAYPLPLLVESLRGKVKMPLFNIVVVLHDVNFGWQRQDLIESFDINPYEIKNEPITAKSQLRFEFILQGDSLVLNIDYDRQALTNYEISSLKKSLPELIDRTLNAPTSPIHTFVTPIAEDHVASKYFDQNF